MTAPSASSSTTAEISYCLGCHSHALATVCTAADLQTWLQLDHHYHAHCEADVIIDDQSAGCAQYIVTLTMSFHSLRVPCHLLT